MGKLKHSVSEDTLSLIASVRDTYDALAKISTDFQVVFFELR